MAKENVKYTRVVNQLPKWFKYANEYYFNNELPLPTITVQSSAKSYAHVTTSKVWESETGSTYEINISADYLNRPIENVIASLLHEMSHLYNIVNGIADTSRNGYYHNKKFYKTATEIAKLDISYDSTIGWSITEPTESTIEFILQYGIEEIKIHRQSSYYPTFGGNSGNKSKGTTAKPKGSNSIKWTCPCCGAIVRSTRELNIVCGDCNVKFERN